MPRSNREETKEKKIPFKKCAGTNCRNKCEFYDSNKKISFCTKCKINYFCSNEAIKIIERKEIEDTIHIVSKVLEAMNHHAKFNNIDSMYHGFIDTLHLYEDRLSKIIKNFKNVGEVNLLDQYSCINNKLIGIVYFIFKRHSNIELKKELDLSELMHNFLKHRFQITLDQSVGSSSEYPVENEIHYDKFLTESKKKIQENCEHEYNAKLEKETERIEQEYRSKLSKLANQVSEYFTITKNKNEEIKKLEKENEDLKVKLNALKEEAKCCSEKFFDVYHLKTGTDKSDEIGNTDFELSMDDQDHTEVLASTKLLKLPDIKRVSFEEVPETNADLLHFLKHSAPNKTDIFDFGWYSNALTKIDYYLDGLDTALKGVTKEIYIRYWIHSKQSLERVIKASCNSSTLIIEHSKLDCDSDFDFSGPKYNTTYLSFDECGTSQGNNWSTNPEKLGRIIKAISLCSMKYSLQTLNVDGCGVSVEKVKEMLSANGMSNVNAIDDYSDLSDDDELYSEENLSSDEESSED